MNYRSVYFALVVCSSIGFVGCNSEPEVVEPTGPEGPPPPTAQDLARKVIADAQLDMPVPYANARFPVPVRTSMLDILQAAKVQHSADAVGKEALEHVVGRIDKRIREFSKANAWQHVMVFTDAHAIFKPDSKKYLSLRDEAHTQLKKPKVKVTGLPEIEGRTLIMLSFYIPMTDMNYKEQVRVGDEIHGLKVVNIFGENRGVTLEYLETGERFVAFMPRQE